MTSWKMHEEEWLWTAWHKKLPTIKTLLELGISQEALRIRLALDPETPTVILEHLAVNQRLQSGILAKTTLETLTETGPRQRPYPPYPPSTFLDEKR